jgi:hypothetical protein
MSVTIRGTDTSAAAPSFTGSDGDSGVFFPAANQVALATNGTQAVVVDASQNVGIGTASPAFRLDVSTSVQDSANFASSNANMDIYLKASGTTSGFTRLRATGGDMVFITGLNERMRIDSPGRVTTPAQPSVWLVNPSDISGTGVITNWTANTNVGGHYNSGTGTFTCPVAGTYYVAAMVWRNTGTVDYAVRRNGTRQARIRQSTVNDCGYSASLTLSCSASDTIDFQIVQNDANNLYGSTGYSQTLTSAVIYLLG